MRYILYSCGEQPINKHFLQMERHIYDNDVIGCIQKNIIMWDENNYGQWFWSEEDIKNLHKESEKLLDSKNARKSIREQKNIVNLYWNKTRKLLQVVNEDIYSNELAKVYDSYSFTLRRLYAHFMTTVPQVTHAVEVKLKEILNKNFPKKKADDQYQILTTPEKPTLLSQELKDWRKILKNPSKENILSHTKKYSILLANVFSEEEALLWAEDRMNNKSIADIDKEIKYSEKRRKALKLKQKKFLQKINSKKVEQLAWFIREGALVRLLIKACWNGEAYHLLPFFRKTAKMAKCSARDLYMFYTWREVSNLLHNNINLPSKELNNRKKYCLLYLSKENIRIYSGIKALEMKKKILDPSLPNRNIKCIYGSIANRGLVVGRAKIIKADNPNEIHKIAKTLSHNHILVTGMTNPTMTILFDRVKGIITDEGGAASHAAIISREFNLPCLVGCKIATLVLMDNDFILLDANKGVIKRIDKKQFEKFEKNYKHNKKVKQFVKKSVTPESKNLTKKEILWFKEINKNYASLVGGKGANLGEMFSRFPIPEGFCIVVSAFEKFLEDAEIKEKIVSLLEGMDTDDLKKIESLSKEIGNLIIKSKIPPKIRNEITQSYRKLRGFVAVRSSAVAEDLEEASFAGQQATFLNVKGEKNLLKYIKECWASFYTARTIVYREKNKFSHKPKIAVIVQKMIDSKKSGVMFTVNPVNKNKGEMVIEAAFGLGEAIVSGMVTPDNFLIDKRKQEAIKETINEKKISIVKQNGKNVVLKLDSKKSNQKTLSEKELKQLIKESLKIENHYKKPMDIEWAIDDKLYILQARPITTL